MEKPAYPSILPTEHLTGGVSYVKKSEDPNLPIVIFRGDADILARVESVEQVVHLKELLINQVEHLSCVITTVKEGNLKEYTLHPDKRSKLVISQLDVTSFGDIDFSKNNIATVLHFRFSSENLLKPIKKKLSKANLMLVLWTYKSQPSTEIRERLCFEVFVKEKLWKSLSEAKQEEIKYFQVITEDYIREKVPTRRLSSNRDGPRKELVYEDTTLGDEEERGVKHCWFFPKNGLPIGVTTYTGIFTDEELDNLEKLIDQNLISAPRDQFQPETFQDNYRGKDNTHLVRSKIFFGARYLWGDGKVAKNDPSAGVRLDVDNPPEWLQLKVEERLLQLNLIPSRGWLNSWAINIYHDGSLGLQSHMDDVSRFEQPIFTLRLYSASRLTFGAYGLGMINPEFYVPMPRGCVTVLEKNGYAANMVTHCIRPSDMSGKSAAIIIRRFRPDVMEAAKKMLP